MICVTAALNMDIRPRRSSAECALRRFLCGLRRSS